MSEIKTFPFDRTGVDLIRNYKYGRNWPVVYLIENGKELYVGETTSVYRRTKEHLDSGGKKGQRRSMSFQTTNIINRPH